MQSSGMWHRVGVVRINVSEESVSSISKEEIICELGTMLKLARFLASGIFLQ
jgi:hypothetical protein